MILYGKCGNGWSTDSDSSGSFATAHLAKSPSGFLKGELFCFYKYPSFDGIGAKSSNIHNQSNCQQLQEGLSQLDFLQTFRSYMSRQVGLEVWQKPIRLPEKP